MSPPAGDQSQNTDLMDDLRVSGTRAQQATFGSRKDINTLNIHQSSKSKERMQGGSQSPRSTTLNKWPKTDDSAAPTLSPRADPTAAQNYGKHHNRRKQRKRGGAGDKDEEILTDLPVSEKKRINGEANGEEGMIDE